MSNNFLSNEPPRERASQYGYSGRADGPRRPRKRSGKRIALIVIADILLAAVGLLIFTYINFIAPRGQKIEAVTLPAATPSAPVMTETQGPASSSETADTAQPAETPQIDQGMWGEKFADKFTDGDVVKTDTTYQSEDINITVEKVQEDGVTYYVADIYVRNLENFLTAFAGGECVRGVAEMTLDMAVENDAVLAISGDYYGFRAEGIVIRNGVLYRQDIFEDILIMYGDGSMKTFSPDDFDIDTVMADGAYQGWSFGPFLMRDGQAMEAGTFNSTVNPANPRCAIGYYEPGHYCFVLVDGRQPGYSNGMTLANLSQLFADLGCSVAYNLDGGQSAAMVFLGELVNQPYDGGREISDIVYIAEVEE